MGDPHFDLERGSLVPQPVGGRAHSQMLPAVLRPAFYAPAAGMTRVRDMVTCMRTHASQVSHMGGDFLRVRFGVIYIRRSHMASALLHSLLAFQMLTGKIDVRACECPAVSQPVCIQDRMYLNECFARCNGERTYGTCTRAPRVSQVGPSNSIHSHSRHEVGALAGVHSDHTLLRMNGIARLELYGGFGRRAPVTDV
jgi:hypothetical protein